MSIVEKLLRYIKIASPSNNGSNTCPSTPEQLEMAKILMEEMAELGLSNVRMKEGYVYGDLDATPGYEDKISIGFIAHMDTSSEFNGYNIKPQIIENYDGRDVILEGSGDILSVAEFPILSSFKGHTLITTDGTSLLGADDKAGIAVIMQAVEDIIANRIPHGPIHIAFTPDEEIGRGAFLFDVEGFGAEVAYTVDGGLPGEIVYENFNAYSAVITITGRSIHPALAKNQLINSQRIAYEFDSMIPEFERPEYTENFEGFYHLISSEGNTEKTVLHYILRDHDNDKIRCKCELLYEIAEFINKKYQKELVHVEIEETYRNMKEMILPHYHLVENAVKACEMEGITAQSIAARGGTDGAQLSFMGLPCPNLSAGSMNYHGKYEYCTKESMELCSRIVKNVISLYANY